MNQLDGSECIFYVFTEPISDAVHEKIDVHDVHFVNPINILGIFTQFADI